MRTSKPSAFREHAIDRLMDEALLSCASPGSASPAVTALMKLFAAAADVLEAADALRRSPVRRRKSKRRRR